MKKLILTLLVLLGAVSQVSAQLYVTGDFDGWKPGTPVEMTPKEDGSYETTISSMEGNIYFAFSTTKGESNADWDGFNAGRLSPETSTLISVGAEQDLVTPTDKSKAYQIIANGNYKIIANPTTMKFKVTCEELADMYITSDDGGWDVSTGTTMVKNENGIYTVSITTSKNDVYLTFGAQLGSTSSDWDGFNAHRFSGSGDLSNTTPRNVWFGSTDAYKIATAGTYNVILDLNNHKVLIDNNQSYYIMSSDGTSWTVGDKMVMTNGWTLSTEFTGAGKEFLIVPDGAVSAGEFTGDWNKVIRPTEGSPRYWVNFANYSASSQTGISGSATDPLWWINDNNPGKLAITYDRSTGNYTINCSYEKVVTDASAGYATFGMPYTVNVDIPDGGAVKYAESISGGAITWQPITDGIPANQGVLLEGTGTYVFTPATSVTDFTSKLVAIPLKTKLAQVIDEKTNYILAKVAESVGFYKVDENGTWVNANTAYLAVAAAEAPSRGFFPFDDDETTGINQIENAQPATVKDAVIYNLNGQRVMNPTKGLYIVNGKKVIIK